MFSENLGQKSGIRGVLTAIGAVAPVLVGSVLVISILALFQTPVQ